MKLFNINIEFGGGKLIGDFSILPNLHIITPPYRFRKFEFAIELKWGYWAIGVNFHS